MPKNQLFPAFLDDVVSPEAYHRWICRKARAHCIRDRARGHTAASVSLYKDAIHHAVEGSMGLDAYTGEKLSWELISKYNNEESKEGKHAYKASFGLLPTVDHVSASDTAAAFKICGWRTNDAKHDLSLADFLVLCRSALEHAGYKVSPPD